MNGYLVLKTFLLAGAAVCVAFAPLSTSAATFSFTEGKGHSRPFVDGSMDLEDAPKNTRGVDLNVNSGQGAFVVGDALLIFGRIVGSQDVFSFTFDTDFTVGFNFDSYFVDGVEVTDTGLVAQSRKGGGPTPGAMDKGREDKGVSFSLKNNDDDSIVSALFQTDVLSIADMGSEYDSAEFFSGLGGVSYTLIVDGSVGPNRRAAALYDLRIEGIAPVPVPASMVLLATALAGMGVVARRRRTRQNA